MGHAQQDQENGRKGADLGVCGEDANQKRGHGHHHHRELERLFPAEAVTDVAEEDSPGRSRQKGGGENAERSQKRIQGVVRGEKILAYHRGQKAEHREIIPFEDVADDAPEHVRDRGSGPASSLALLRPGDPRLAKEDETHHQMREALAGCGVAPVLRSFFGMWAINGHTNHILLTNTRI